MNRKITEHEKEECRKDLEEIRLLYGHENAYRRLGSYPTYSSKLFNVGCLPFGPCRMFGKHLVLKIIDELLD